MGFFDLFESSRANRYQRLQSRQTDHAGHGRSGFGDDLPARSIRSANLEYEKRIDYIMQRQKTLNRNNLAERDSRMDETNEALEAEHRRLDGWLAEQETLAYQNYKSYYINEAELEKVLKRVRKSKDDQLAAMTKWHKKQLQAHRDNYAAKKQRIAAEIHAEFKEAKAILQSTKRR